MGTNIGSMTKGVLIDLDGVVYKGNELIQGSGKAITWLQQNNIPFLFVTNTSSQPRSRILNKLISMGISVEKEQILTPPIAACQWLKAHSSEPTALFIAPETLEDFQGIKQLSSNEDTGAKSVVIGDLAEEWSFSILNRAFRLLMAETKPKLIALGMTRYWKAQDGLRLDVAPFVKALQHASSCEVIVTGKPSEIFYQQAIQLTGLKTENLIMIGDDIKVDVFGAQQSGLKGVLVRTGKFRNSDLQGSIVPDEVLSSLAALPDWWQNVDL